MRAFNSTQEELFNLENCLAWKGYQLPLLAVDSWVWEVIQLSWRVGKTGDTRNGISLRAL